jgi:hypothetical protein
VCLDPWSTQLRFSDGGQITLEGGYEHIDANRTTHTHQEGKEQDRGPVFLRDLIQKRIVEVRREDWLLTLIFENGAELRIKSEAGPYEGGQIYRPGGDRVPLVF